MPALFELVEDADADLPDVLRSHLRDACSEIRELKDKCAGIEHELKALTKQLPEVQRLLAIPGIGLLTATAIVGFVGDLRRFPSGRRFSSYLGLVPKENSSGDIRRFGRITKRGDSLYLLFIHPRDGDHGYTQPERAPGGRAVSGRTLQPLGPHRSMTGVDSTSLATSWSVSRYERRTKEERHPFEAC